MTSPNEVRNIAERAVRMAKQAGVDTAEANVSLSTDFEVEVRDGEVENLSEADSHSIHITVSIDGKRASVSSCDFSDTALQKLVDQAVFLCKYTDRDPFYTLPPEELMATNLPDLDLFDTSLMETTPEQWISKIVELERMSASMDNRLISDGSYAGTNRSSFALANSLGFCEGLETTSVSLGVSLFAEDKHGVNTGRKQSGGYSSSSCFAEDLESLTIIADQASRKVIRKLGAKKPGTGIFPVYFEPAMARKIWDSLLSAMKGGLIYRQESYLAGRLHKQVAHQDITINEDPFIKRGPGSSSFDSEGVQRKQRDLITNGNLETYLLSTYSANKLGLWTTGHAGGYGNICIKPGQWSEKEMLAEMGTGLWLTGLSGQGIKLTTGDYSRGATGLWIEQGEVAYPVSEFTISSNLEHMFNHISMLGNNPESRYTIVTPGLVISEMSLSGMS